MAVTHAKKVEVLNELLNGFAKSKATFFGGYQGLPVKNFSVLRKEIRKAGGEYKAAKKTLIRLAARKSKLPEPTDDLLLGSVGCVFSYEDEMAALKVLHTFAKKFPQVVLLGGIMEGKLINAADVKALASLPGRLELLAKLVGSMKSPISGFHGVLHGVLRSFVAAMSEVQKKKAAETPVDAVVVESAPVAEVPAVAESVPAA